MMNQDQAEGLWQQVKGRAKKAWGELTDDDFLKAEGSLDKLYGVIQEKVGDSEEAIKAKLQEAERALDEAKGAVADRAAASRTTVKAILDRPKAK